VYYSGTLNEEIKMTKAEKTKVLLSTTKERKLFIKELAEHQGTTMSAVINSMIDSKIKRKGSK